MGRQDSSARLERSCSYASAFLRSVGAPAKGNSHGSTIAKSARNDFSLSRCPYGSSVSSIPGSCIG
jgi:hypothetical protein